MCIRDRFIANSLGLEAVGISATLSQYPGQPLREVREMIEMCIRDRYNWVNEHSANLFNNNSETFPNFCFKIISITSIPVSYTHL